MEVMTEKFLTIFMVVLTLSNSINAAINVKNVKRYEGSSTKAVKIQPGSYQNHAPSFSFIEEQIRKFNKMKGNIKHWNRYRGITMHVDH